MSTPSNDTLPWYGVKRPDAVRSIVDLPAPFVPSSAMVSPRRTSRLVPNSTCSCPYATSTLRNASATGASSAARRPDDAGRLRVATGFGVPESYSHRDADQRRARHPGVGDERGRDDAASPRDEAQPGVADAVEHGSEAAGKQPQHEQQADAAAREREQETEAHRRDHAEPLGALDEDRPHDRAGHRAEAADDDHRERAEALDGREDLLAECLLVQHEQTARERREEAGERKREQLHARRAQAEGLRAALVVARGHDVTLDP